MGTILRIGLIGGFVPAIIYAGMTWAYRADHIGLGQLFGNLELMTKSLLVGGAVLALVTLLSFLTKRALLGGIAVLATVISLAMAAGPIQMRKIAKEVPPIHDISTDVNNPPAFVSTAPMRTEGMNPVEYDTGQTDRQLEAYPDLEPITVSASPDEAFAACVKAAEAQGLGGIDSDKTTGRVEGTATTRWFGFKDDVVFRVQPGENGGSIIDIRSKSRVGGSDVGANAARIRELRERILKELGE